MSVRDHLEVGDELGIIVSQGGRGGYGRGSGPREEYEYLPHIYHEVLIEGYYRHLHHRNDNKGDKGDNNEDTTGATVVDPAIHPVTLYHRVRAWDTYRLWIKPTLLASRERRGCGGGVGGGGRGGAC